MITNLTDFLWGLVLGVFVTGGATVAILAVLLTNIDDNEQQGEQA